MVHVALTAQKLLVQLEVERIVLGVHEAREGFAYQFVACVAEHLFESRIYVEDSPFEIDQSDPHPRFIEQNFKSCVAVPHSIFPAGKGRGKVSGTSSEYLRKKLRTYSGKLLPSVRSGFQMTKT